MGAAAAAAMVHGGPCPWSMVSYYCCWDTAMVIVCRLLCVRVCACLWCVGWAVLLWGGVCRSMDVVGIGSYALT